MTRVENRLKDVFNGLSPEDKARLIIEDQFRADPVLKPGDVYKMVARIKPDEGFRFNKIISGYNSLIRNFSTMTDLSDQIRKRLLQRDRFLWYRRALRDVEEAMVFDPKVSNPLLVDNSNIKIGRPLEMDLTLARLRLEVWSSKNRRCAWPLNGSVESVKGGEKVYHCGGGIVYHRHDEKGLNWEPGGIRSGAGVRSSGVSQESTGSSDTWEAALCRLCLRR